MLRRMAPLPAVSASACAILRWMVSEKPVRSPMKAMRAPRRCSSSISWSSMRRNNFISAPTSSAGRFQFSLENANRVSASICCSRQNSRQTCTARTPARCPRLRGRLRRSAQRPLPSMMTARWRGLRAGGFKTGVPGSERQQFLFLVLHHFVDVLDELVGELLDLRVGGVRFVLGHHLLLEQFLDVLDGVAVHVADGDLGGL